MYPPRFTRLAICLAATVALAFAAGAPAAPEPPLFQSSHSETKTSDRQWNTVQYDLPAPVAYADDLVLKGKAAIDSAGDLTYLGSSVITASGKKLFLHQAVTTPKSFEFAFALKTGVIASDSASREPLGPQDRIVKFTLYARLNGPASSTFTVEKVELVKGEVPAPAKPAAGRVSTPTRDPLYEGTFTLLPGVSGVHPRLLVTKAEIEDAEAHYRRDPVFFAPVLPPDPVVNATPVPLLPDNAGSAHKIAWLACAYRVTRDPVYLQALQRWTPQIAAFESYDIPHIGSTNRDLTTSDYLLYLALSYDVLKDVADPTLVEAIRGALARQAASTYHSLVNLEHFPYEQNHFTKPISGLGLAGMALVDELPEARDWAVYARNVMERADEAVSHDGWYFEGMSYWGYTFYTTALFTEALRNTTGINWMEKPPYRLAPLYLAHCFLPDANFFFDFGDTGPRVNADGTAQDGYDAPWHTRPMRINALIPYAIQRSSHDELLAAFINRVAPLATMGATSVSPMCELLWQDCVPENPVPIPDATKAPPHHYFDDMEIVTWRNSWADPAATALAFKAGPPAGHHIAGQLPLYPEWKPSFGHAQPDAGSFILFAKGAYLVGVTEYTVKRSAYGSTLLVDGAGQSKEGTAWATFNREPYSKYDKIHLENVWLGRDVAAGTAVFQDAYDDELKLRSVRRDLLMIGGRYLVVRDTIRSDAPHEYEWRLQTDREVRSLRPNRFVEENGAARLVVESLDPAASFKAEPTVVETELYSETRSRPQQRGFHLALMSPKAADFQFLNAFCVQSVSEKESAFTAKKIDGGKVELSDGNGTCTVWVGPGQELDGTFAYVLRDAKGALTSAGLEGKALKSSGLTLTLPTGGNAAIHPDGRGGWQAATMTAANPPGQLAVGEAGKPVLQVPLARLDP